jgi:DNA-binding NtrC family response regulator
MKVLIADDNKNLRAVIMNELAENRFEVEGAENGRIVMQLLAAKEYDVLLLDLTMPGLGGMEVLKRIKESDLSIEVVIFGANTSISSAVEAMRLGAYDYLTKPFRIEDLVSIDQAEMEELIRGQRQRFTVLLG